MKLLKDNSWKLNLSNGNGKICQFENSESLCLISMRHLKCQTTLFPLSIILKKISRMLKDIGIVHFHYLISCILKERKNRTLNDTTVFYKPFKRKIIRNLSFVTYLNLKLSAFPGQEYWKKDFFGHLDLSMRFRLYDSCSYIYS